MTREELDAVFEMAQMLAKAAVEDPDLPEERKINLRLMMELRKTQELVDSMVVYTVPDFREERLNQLYPLRKEVYEYLQLVNMGIRTFVQTHPIPEAEQT